MLMIVLALIIGVINDDGPRPWESAEHRILADAALRAVLGELGDRAPHVAGQADALLSMNTTIWTGRDFGDLTATLAENDASVSRHQHFGRSVFDQLSGATTVELSAFWEQLVAHHGGSAGSTLIFPKSSSVVVNYLQSHLAAIRYGNEAGAGTGVNQDAFQLMLAYESMAQGFLADAHAAGHMMVPREDALQALHPINNRRAHDYHNIEGLFVMNGRHETWETFGDGVLTWYARSYRQVEQAAVTSLREVLTAYYVGAGSVPDTLKNWIVSVTSISPADLVSAWLDAKSGREYYSGTASLPSLSYIPMPASATWSIRTDETDDNGTRVRRHYPQFVEEGYHDPDLPSVIRSRLYPRESFPERFVPAVLQNESTPAAAADSSQDAVSVEFFNAPTIHPDYAGLTIGFGLGLLAEDDESAPALTGTIGYGIADNILIASQLGINIGITKSLDDDFDSPVTIGFAMNPGGLPVRTEVAYVTTTDDFLSESGVGLSGRFNLASGVLGLTYIGMSLRPGYTVLFLDDVVHVASVNVTFY